jgi:hypothetical protein
MHPKLLESTVAQCRAYVEAGDCHGEARPSERLIDAVVQLADAGVTLSSADAAFLAARLRRLFQHFGTPLPDGTSDDDERLIGIAGAAIGMLLTGRTDGASASAASVPDAPKTLSAEPAKEPR